MLITPELSTRPARSPDYKAQGEAMSTLLRDMAAVPPESTFRPLLEVAMRLCDASTAAVSLLDETGPEPVFRWPEIVGRLAHYVGGTMPRDNSPCGIVIKRSAPQLFSRLTRYYTFVEVDSPLVEVLLIPFFIDGRPVGTLWVVASEEGRQFDAEDARILSNLADLASAALKLRGHPLAGAPFSTPWVDPTAPADSSDLNRTLRAQVAELSALAQQRAIQLKALSSELAEVKVRERRRVAGILHDELQQLLVGVKLQLQTFKSPQARADRDSILRVEKTVNEAIQASRALTSELDARHDDGTIEAGLRRIARDYQEHHGFNVAVKVGRGFVEPSDAQVRGIAIGATRELLFNVLKHAGVRKAQVSVATRGSCTEIVVADGGHGFDPDSSSNHGGFGLLSVRERLAGAEGELKIESAPGKGTRARIILPGADSKPGDCSSPRRGKAASNR